MAGSLSSIHGNLTFLEFLFSCLHLINTNQNNKCVVFSVLLGGGVCIQSLGRVWLLVIPWAVAWHAPLSMGFVRQKYWSGLPYPTPGDLPNSGIKPGPPALAKGFFYHCATWEAPFFVNYCSNHKNWVSIKIESRWLMFHILEMPLTLCLFVSCLHHCIHIPVYTKQLLS